MEQLSLSNEIVGGLLLVIGVLWPFRVMSLEWERQDKPLDVTHYEIGRNGEKETVDSMLAIECAWQCV